MIWLTLFFAWVVPLFLLRYLEKIWHERNGLRPDLFDVLLVLFPFINIIGVFVFVVLNMEDQRTCKWFDGRTIASKFFGMTTTLNKKKQ